jgi:hypothetical protein
MIGVMAGLAGLTTDIVFSLFVRCWLLVLSASEGRK